MAEVPIFMDEVDERVGDDDIESSIMRALMKHRERPMSSEAIANGQALLLDTFGRARAQGPSTASAKKSPDAPFLVACRKLFAVFDPRAQPGSAPAPPRSARMQIAAQRTVCPLDASLRASTLYETMENAMAPVFHMIKTQTGHKGSPFQCSMAATMGFGKVRELVTALEGKTGFHLEGAVGIRQARLLLMIFDHNDTERHAAIVVVHVCPDQSASAAPLGRHPITAGVDELFLANETTGAEVADAILFSDDYFRRDSPAETPWAQMLCGFVNYVYFDRLQCPYESFFS